MRLLKEVLLASEVEVQYDLLLQVLGQLHAESEGLFDSLTNHGVPKLELGQSVRLLLEVLLGKDILVLCGVELRRLVARSHVRYQLL